MDNVKFAKLNEDDLPSIKTGSVSRTKRGKNNESKVSGLIKSIPEKLRNLPEYIEEKLSSLGYPDKQSKIIADVVTNKAILVASLNDFNNPEKKGHMMDINRVLDFIVYVNKGGKIFKLERNGTLDSKDKLRAYTIKRTDIKSEHLIHKQVKDQIGKLKPGQFLVVATFNWFHRSHGLNSYEWQDKKGQLFSKTGNPVNPKVVPVVASKTTKPKLASKTQQQATQQKIQELILQGKKNWEGIKIALKKAVHNGSITLPRYNSIVSAVKKAKPWIVLTKKDPPFSRIDIYIKPGQSNLKNLKFLSIREEYNGMFKPTGKFLTKYMSFNIREHKTSDDYIPQESGIFFVLGMFPNYDKSNFLAIKGLDHVATKIRRAASSSVPLERRRPAAVIPQIKKQNETANIGVKVVKPSVIKNPYLLKATRYKGWEKELNQSDVFKVNSKIERLSSIGKNLGKVIPNKAQPVEEQTSKKPQKQAQTTSEKELISSIQAYNEGRNITALVNLLKNHDVNDKDINLISQGIKDLKKILALAGKLKKDNPFGAARLFELVGAIHLIGKPTDKDLVSATNAYNSAIMVVDNYIKKHTSKHGTIKVSIPQKRLIELSKFLADVHGSRGDIYQSQKNYTKATNAYISAAYYYGIIGDSKNEKVFNNLAVEMQNKAKAANKAQPAEQTQKTIAKPVKLSDDERKARDALTTLVYPAFKHHFVDSNGRWYIPPEKFENSTYNLLKEKGIDTPEEMKALQKQIGMRGEDVDGKFGSKTYAHLLTYWAFSPLKNNSSKYIKGSKSKEDVENSRLFVVFKRGFILLRSGRKDKLHTMIWQTFLNHMIDENILTGKRLKVDGRYGTNTTAMTRALQNKINEMAKDPEFANWLVFINKNVIPDYKDVIGKNFVKNWLLKKGIAVDGKLGAQTLSGILGLLSFYYMRKESKAKKPTLPQKKEVKEQKKIVKKPVATPKTNKSVPKQANKGEESLDDKYKKLIQKLAKKNNNLDLKGKIVFGGVGKGTKYVTIHYKEPDENSTPGTGAMWDDVSKRIPVDTKTLTDFYGDVTPKELLDAYLLHAKNEGYPKDIIEKDLETLVGLMTRAKPMGNDVTRVPPKYKKRKFVILSGKFGDGVSNILGEYNTHKAWQDKQKKTNNPKTTKGAKTKINPTNPKSKKKTKNQ